MAVAGWWADQRQEAVAYLVEENRVLRAHLRGRVQLTDEETLSVGSPRTSARPSAPRSSRDDRHARHDSALASADHRAEMDVRDAAETPRRPRRDPTACHPDGGGESHLGLYADPRRAEECRTSRRTFDDRANPEGARAATGAGATDLVADVSTSALGRDLLARISSRPRCGPGAAS